MRAQLWLEQESHWKLTNRDEHTSFFRFGPAVRFFFPDKRLQAFRVDRVFCGLVYSEDESDPVEKQRLIFFLGNQDEMTFDMPSGCVWVAGEVEL